MPAPAHNPLLASIIEAILFVGREPLDADRLAAVLADIAPADVAGTIAALGRRYRRQNRPYRVAHRHGGYVLELLPAYAQALRQRSRTERGVRLNRAAVEVLSVVAYRQPIGRQELAELLSIDVRPALRQLVRHRLLELAAGANGDSAGRYVTTGRFLELFGLNELADLPTAHGVSQS